MARTEAERCATRYLQCALDIGSNMLIRGAEIHRVEDTIRRICLAYGAEWVEVFSTTYCVIVTISAVDYGPITQSRRIEAFSYNLQIMELLNDLSRHICVESPSVDWVNKEVQQIIHLPPYSNRWIIVAYAMISAAFTIFFGGTAADAGVSGVIGVAMRLVEHPLRTLKINRFIVVCICSAVAGFLATTLVGAGWGDSATKVSIGNIMVFIPGLLFTNSVRDLFADNMISGFVRTCEAVIMSMVIAFGFAIAHTGF